MSTADDDLITRLKGERGTALQAASCYKAQRDLAWAEIDSLKQRIEMILSQHYD